MERRGAAPRPRAFDLGDPRTPMAWQHRNFNFQQEHQHQMQIHGQPLYAERFINGATISPSDIMQYPSDSCDEPTLEEVHHLSHQHAQYSPKYPMHYHHHQQQQHVAALTAAAAGQLASTHTHLLRGSTPILPSSLPTGRSPRATKLGPRSRSRSTAGRRPATTRCALSTSSNSSASSASTALDSDSQMRVDADLQADDLRQLGIRAPTLGTLRSVQSTLSTWDGEPCAVHHVQLGFELPMGLLLPPPPPPLYPLMALTLPAAPPPPPPPPPPSVLLPPMLRPRPLVLAADAAARPEPLPVRDPKGSVSPLPPKDIGGVSRTHCCKGNIIVLWVVLGIIFVGILLAIILRFVTA